jgi:hypothetical protein
LYYARLTIEVAKYISGMANYILYFSENKGIYSYRFKRVFYG